MKLWLFSVVIVYVHGYQHESLIVDEHNKFRRMEPAANMQKMVWNSRLAQAAQGWADKCTLGHERVSGYGENLFYVSNGKMSDTAAISLGIEEWYNEKSDWYWGKGFSAATGHYTQVVWAETNQVGCGTAVCQSKGYFYLVCFYTPRGNIGSQNPYIKGAKCTKCPSQKSKCEQGLCSASGSVSPGNDGNTWDNNNWNTGGDTWNNDGNTGGGDTWDNNAGNTGSTGNWWDNGNSWDNGQNTGNWWDETGNTWNDGTWDTGNNDDWNTWDNNWDTSNNDWDNTWDNGNSWDNTGNTWDNGWTDSGNSWDNGWTDSGNTWGNSWDNNGNDWTGYYKRGKITRKHNVPVVGQGRNKMISIRQHKMPISIRRILEALNHMKRLKVDSPLEVKHKDAKETENKQIGKQIERNQQEVTALKAISELSKGKSKPLTSQKRKNAVQR